MPLGGIIIFLKILSVPSENLFNTLLLGRDQQVLSEVDRRASQVVIKALSDIQGQRPSSIQSFCGKSDRFAFGDIHGNLVGAVQNFYMAGLVDAQGRWIGGKKTLIQLGDMIDRGPYSWETYRYLKHLQTQARAEGGDVVILLGNHELDFLLYFGNGHAVRRADDSIFRSELIRDILTGDIRAAFVDQAGQLCTHAGVHSRLLAVIQREIGGDQARISVHQIANWLNQKVKEDIQQLSDQSFPVDQARVFSIFDHPIYQAGRERGGSAEYGGIFWEDARHLISFQSHFPQVVGHTGTNVLCGENRVCHRDGIHFTDVGLTFAKAGYPQAFIAFNGDESMEIIKRQVFQSPLILACDHWKVRPILDV